VTVHIQTSVAPRGGNDPNGSPDIPSGGNPHETPPGLYTMSVVASAADGSRVHAATLVFTLLAGKTINCLSVLANRARSQCNGFARPIAPAFGGCGSLKLKAHRSTFSTVVLLNSSFSAWDNRAITNIGFKAGQTLAVARGHILLSAHSRPLLNAFRRAPPCSRRCDAHPSAGQPAHKGRIIPQ
jgi:hypothetical protein